VRLALVTLTVLAVVLPTTLIPQAAAHGNLFSVHQVLHVFKAEGLGLQRVSRDVPAGAEAFSPSSPVNDFQVSVVVFRNGSRLASAAMSRTAYFGGSILISTTGSSGGPPAPQKWSTGSTRRGNVSVFWARTGHDISGVAEVRAALRRLRYSTRDATLSPPPTIVLHAGESSTVDTATAPGAMEEIECVYRQADAGWVVTSGQNPPLIPGTSGRNEAILRSRSGSGSSEVFTCQGEHVTGTQLDLGGPISVCHAGPSTVRLGRFEARVPRGWYFATSTEQGRKDLWIGDLRGCAGLQPFTPARHHIYVQVSQVAFPTSVPAPGFPHQRARSFLIHAGHDAAARWIDEYGFYDRPIFSETVVYSVATSVGRDLRNAKGIRRADAVLRGITLRPR
jgi:hypothetical protein